jgi:hypothetical protein
MKTRSTLTLTLRVTALSLCGIAANANAEDCTVAKPCEQTLYVMPGGSAVHLEYGDTILLKFDGNKTVLVPDVEDWEDKTINPKLVEVWQPGTLSGEGRIILMWEFKVKSEKNSHTPGDKEHTEVRLYKNPDSADVDWIIYNAKHSDGSIHGGTAHMRQ